ncbi:MAG: major facilitator superfamily transporter, partial [Frankiales bacterium]|nr:major facilitator superfamily transporter [Frankiales bacterium]
MRTAAQDAARLHAERRASAAEKRVVLTAFAVFGVFWGAWAALLPAVQRTVGVGDGLLGLALGALAVAALPSMPVAGRLTDRHGVDEALQVTLLGFALVLPLPALATGLPVLVVALVLLGVATGALDVVANTAAAAWERAEEHSGRTLMSLAHGCFSFGVLGGSASAGLAREAGVSPLAVLLLVGAATAAVASRVPAHRSTGSGAADAERGRRLSSALLLVGLLVAGSFLVEDGLQSWSALHLERGLGAGPAVSGLGPALFAGAMGFGRLGGHLLGTRTSPARLLGGGGALTAAGVALLVVAPSPLPALVGLAVAGAGTSVLAPVLYTAVGLRAAAGRQGADLAVVSALGYGGFVAGPPLVGAVSAASSLPAALGLLGVVAA